MLPVTKTQVWLKIFYWVRGAVKFWYTPCTPSVRTPSLASLPAPPGSDEQPSFCGDSYFIAFTSNRSGPNQIYLTTRHGGDAKKVPTGSGDASFPRWGAIPR